MGGDDGVDREGASGRDDDLGKKRRKPEAGEEDGTDSRGTERRYSTNGITGNRTLKKGIP